MSKVPPLIFLVVAAILVGCARAPSLQRGSAPLSQGRRGEPLIASQKVVEVYVPCGVAPPFQAIKAAFEENHPGVSVRMLVEGNVDLVKRLGKGERPDVFVNIGDREIALLVGSGAVVAESQRVYATTSLVLVTPRRNPYQIRRLTDLTHPAVKRIALADPDRVSSGYHARRLLQRAGLWEAVQPKLLIKSGARGPLNLVLKGRAEAAFIYSTCLYEDRSRPPSGPEESNPGLEVISLAEEAAPIPCQAALTVKGSSSAKAQEFLDFLTGSQAQAALRAWQWQAPSAGGRKSQGQAENPTRKEST